MLSLFLCCLARRDDPDKPLGLPVAVGYDQHAKAEAQPQQEEPVLFSRVVGIEGLDRLVVEEDRLRLLERDAVLPLVGLALPVVPGEAG